MDNVTEKIAAKFRGDDGWPVVVLEHTEWEELIAHIRALEAENDRLTGCLKRANSQAEHFEREWYLAGDELSTLREKVKRMEEQEPVAYRAWFDKDQSAKWLFTLWPEECNDDFDWEPLYTHPVPRTLYVPDGWELVPTELGTDLYNACDRACSKGYGFGGLDEIMDKINEAYHLKPLAAPLPTEKNRGEGYRQIAAQAESLLLGPAQPSPTDEELRRDAERYRWLRDLQCNHFTLSRNEDHAPNYTTAKEWIEDYYPEGFKDCDPAEVDRMKSTNTIWSLQIYPDTPVGFVVWYGVTLESVVSTAIEAEKREGE
jgi:hypothetical protein